MNYAQFAKQLIIDNRLCIVVDHDIPDIRPVCYDAAKALVSMVEKMHHTDMVFPKTNIPVTTRYMEGHLIDIVNPETRRSDLQKSQQQIYSYVNGIIKDANFDFRKSLTDRLTNESDEGCFRRHATDTVQMNKRVLHHSKGHYYVLDLYTYLARCMAHEYLLAACDILSEEQS